MDPAFLACRGFLLRFRALGHQGSRREHMTNWSAAPPEFLFSALEVERQQEVQDIQQNYLKRLNELQKTGAASGTEVLNVRPQIIASEAMLKRSLQANELFTAPYGRASLDEAAEKEKIAEARIKNLESDLRLAREDFGRLDIIAPESGAILSTARRFPGEKGLHFLLQDQGDRRKSPLPDRRRCHRPRRNRHRSPSVLETPVFQGHRKKLERNFFERPDDAIPSELLRPGSVTSR